MTHLGCLKSHKAIIKKSAGLNSHLEASFSDHWDCWQNLSPSNVRLNVQAFCCKTSSVPGEYSQFFATWHSQYSHLVYQAIKEIQ